MTETEFLLARLVEAEKTADLDEQLGHISRQEFDCVMVDIQTKRQIVALHESWPVLVTAPAKIERYDSDLDSYVMRMSQEIAWATTREYVARFGIDPPTAPIIALLASVFADHPDYPARVEAPA